MEAFSLKSWWDERTVWVEDARAEEVARTMVEAARTGRMGDGKVFVMPVLGGRE